MSGMSSDLSKAFYTKHFIQYRLSNQLYSVKQAVMQTIFNSAVEQL